ncbi:alpha/beta fold hydrolase [Nocardioides bruguierae]|uniref:Alpha/beta fold hydrolase n=1 Tax=Nocardioides bruguierae TaxID=2945102 RepID=A0A9X2D6A6_9ACTN|nr:alpha/beta fold hydrolase [Nocardioides bruguierae]MCM0620202.1 alpha/beta fold hydrolase [Nocardioides bruguierae]
MDRLTEVTTPDGLVLDVTDTGPLDGTPVVLLHGFPERATSWRLVAPLLHERGLRTFAVDQRGYAPRARPRGRRAYRLKNLADDAGAVVAAVRAATGQPVHVAGHDWGAAVAWAVAARPGLVASLTALSVPHPAAFVRSFTRSDQARRSWYMGFFQLPRVPEALARSAGGPLESLLARTGMTTPELARFRAEVVETGALTGALGWYRALPLAPPRVGRVRVPTTMVWSDGDDAIGRAAAEGCEDFVVGEYELVVLGGVTHWIPTQAPEAAAEAIAARVRGDLETQTDEEQQ